MEVDIGNVITLVVALVVIAALIPMALTMLTDEEVTDSLPKDLRPIWNTIPMFAILGLAIGVISMAIGYDVLKKR